MSPNFSVYNLNKYLNTNKTTIANM